jgi:hypothetical protein
LSKSSPSSGLFVVRVALQALIATAVCGPALGQEPAATAVSDPQTDWSWGISAAWYMLPDESDYVQPTVKADRDWLHLETRYAYEDRKSISFFAGANFEFGTAAKLAVTPMIGGLVGQVDGVIPALELDFTVWRFEAYGEAEYVFDLDDSSSNYVYVWSELSLWPTESLRAGMVSQRTRVHRRERDVQHGPLVGVAFSRLEAAFYLFSPGSDDRLAVLSVGLSF